MTREVLEVIAAAIVSLGFGGLYQLPRRRLPVVALGGALGWAVYLLAAGGGLDVFNSYFLAALAVAVFSETMARILRTPTVQLIVAMLIPMVPGADLYYMMEGLVRHDQTASSYHGRQLFVVAGAIALAIIVSGSLFNVGTDILRRSQKGKGQASDS